MKKCLTYCLLSICLLSTNFASSQDTLQNVFRPRIGVGTGVMTYYGEVQNYQKGFSSMVNRYGGLLYVNAPVTRFFNLEFSATYAKIAANERTLARNFNFESRIRMASVMLYYNFYPVVKKYRSKFHPFLGVGFSSFEFLSKTDLFDANGNQYHYWSDGSIMSLDENDPLAPTDAVALTRDYTYETDLRELNADDLGKYREQSFALPLSAGFEMHMSPRWDFRVATTYTFAFTDLIDNISSAGEGIREGDEKNDRMLFTYVSLSYDLQFGNKEGAVPPEFEQEEGIDLYAEWDPNDFDNDGVIDALDQCPATPLEALVDENGCPLDTDMDGVPDYRDNEPDTAPDSYVDEYGVTMTAADFEEHLRLYYDSTGYEHDFEEFRTEVILNREKSKSYKGVQKDKSGLSYVLVVGKEKKDMTVNDLHKYLGYRDYSTVVKGDTVYYTLGEYSSIEEAVAAKTGLEQSGVFVEDIGRNSGSTENLFAVDEKVIEKVEKVNIQKGQEVPDFEESGEFYRVQLGAFKNKIDVEKTFPGIDVVYGASETDNLNRYYTGSFKTYEQADSCRKVMKRKGIKSAFVVAYDKQQRITLKEAGVDESSLPSNYSEENELQTFVEPYDEKDPNDTVSQRGGIDMSKVKYRVLLVHILSTDDIPVETVDILYNIRTVKPVKNKRDGSTSYYSKEFSTKEERDAALEEYSAYGLESVQPVVEYNGVFYTEEEFKALTGN